ncbi:MAG: type II toxin-antitoxin system VapC family toxin [Oceanicaulis sp.]
MAAYCLDASAVLAVLLGEPSASKVELMLERACLSAVNYSEVGGKLYERGLDVRTVEASLVLFRPMVAPFDFELADAAAALRPATRHAGLSLGDRACLALARAHGAVAVTADRAWADLEIGVEINIIR